MIDSYRGREADAVNMPDGAGMDAVDFSLERERLSRTVERKVASTDSMSADQVSCGVIKESGAMKRTLGVDFMTKKLALKLNLKIRLCPFEGSARRKDE